MSGNFVIAGGSKGIGLELVRLLDLSADRIDVFSREIGGLGVSEKIRHHVCDFTADEAQLADLPDSIQGAVYCPGSINLRSFRSLKADDFRRDFEINLIGAVKFLQACLTGLKKAIESLEQDGEENKPLAVYLRRLTDEGDLDRVVDVAPGAVGRGVQHQIFGSAVGGRRDPYPFYPHALHHHCVQKGGRQDLHRHHECRIDGQDVWRKGQQHHG